MSASKKAARERRKLEATAYHEAGHAVACIVLEHPFLSATIIATDETLGSITKRPVPPSITREDELTHRSRRWIEREILCWLAGLAAEQRWTGRNNWRGARSDISWVVELGAFLHQAGTKVLDKYLDYMIERARDLVSAPQNWLRIEALATALLERRTLSAREAKRLCLEAMKDRVKADLLEARMRAQAAETVRDSLT